MLLRYYVTSYLVHNRDIACAVPSDKNVVYSRSVVIRDRVRSCPMQITQCKKLDGAIKWVMNLTELTQ